MLQPYTQTVHWIANTSLLRTFVNCGRKKFYNIGQRKDKKDVRKHVMTCFAERDIMF